MSKDRRNKVLIVLFFIAVLFMFAVPLVRSYDKTKVYCNKGLECLRKGNIDEAVTWFEYVPDYGMIPAVQEELKAAGIPTCNNCGRVIGKVNSCICE